MRTGLSHCQALKLEFSNLQREKKIKEINDTGKIYANEIENERC